METSRGAKGVARSGISVCPTYQFCKEQKWLHRSPVSDDYRDQQVAILRDLLQAIKEAALRFTQLLERRRQAEADSRHREVERCEGNDQRRKISSEVILASTSSSVCALCGIGLHLKNPSKEFVLQEFDAEPHRDRDIALKHLENILSVKLPDKVPSPPKPKKSSDDFIVHEGIFHSLSPKGSDRSIVEGPAREQKKIAKDPKARPLEASEEQLKSKLLAEIPPKKIILHIRPHEFQQKRDNATQMLEHAAEREYKVDEASKLAKVIRQTPKMPPFTIFPVQDASTLTQEVFCPCACGLLAEDQTKSQESIESLLKRKLIKAKLEELGLRLPPKKMEPVKMRDDVRMKKVKSEEMEKDKQIQLRKQEIAQLRLQAQVEELHRSIRFFKEENEIIRRLLEESRRYSSMKTRGLRQALPTRLTYSGLEVAIRLLRAKYSGTHGVIATLTEMVRGSMIIQRITEKLLAPFAMHQHRNASSAATSHELSASEVEAFLETTSSRTRGVY